MKATETTIDPTTGGVEGVPCGVEADSGLDIEGWPTAPEGFGWVRYKGDGAHKYEN